MSQPDNSNYVRRVVLPSGRAIEVVYFENQPAHAPPPLPASRPAPTSTSAPSATSTSSTPSSGRRPPPTHWEVAAALPQLRVDRPSGCSTRTPSTASTRSSTTAPRRSSATSSASRGPTWRRRWSASRQRPGLRRHLADGLLGVRGRRPSRPPARAPRAGRSGSSGRSAFAAATISSASVARLLQHAGRGDRVAHRLRLRRASARRAGRARPAPGSRSRARMNGSVTVPSSRSVPRCLPVRSAGPGDVEHVVEQLEREPDAAAEVAERVGLAAALERAQPARRLEQPRGLEVAAVQVALAR